jgi:hypothetical protein
MSNLDILITTGAITIALISQPMHVHSQENGRKVDKRIYAGRDLEQARKTLQDHQFKHADIRKLFYDNDTQAVVLELVRTGREIREIRILQGTRQDNGRVNLKKTLNDPKDDGFRGLVDRLKL